MSSLTDWSTHEVAPLGEVDGHDVGDEPALVERTSSMRCSSTSAALAFSAVAGSGGAGLHPVVEEEQRVVGLPRFGLQLKSSTGLKV